MVDSIDDNQIGESKGVISQGDSVMVTPQGSRVTRAKGGARPGAGRKPFAATVLRRRLIEDKLSEAEASFAYIVAVRDNEDERADLRLAAAVAVLDRVLGKARQSVDATVSGVIASDDLTGLSVHDRAERIAALWERRAVPNEEKAASVEAAG